MDAPKDPANYTWVTYGWVLLLSSWGGVVSFMRKRKSGLVRAFNFSELFGEIFTSAGVGILTFFMCEYTNVPPLLSAVFIAVSGHMGPRALFGLEQVFEAKFGIKLPEEGSEK